MCVSWCVVVSIERSETIHCDDSVGDFELLQATEKADHIPGNLVPAQWHVECNVIYREARQHGPAAQPVSHSQHRLHSIQAGQQAGRASLCDSVKYFSCFSPVSRLVARPVWQCCQLSWTFCPIFKFCDPSKSDVR